MTIQDYFAGKGCVVTGAASGIGLAVSEALLECGAAVFMADRDAERLAASVERLKAHGDRVHSGSVDVTRQEQVRQFIREAESRHGRLDVLFNNAGVGGTAPIETVTLEFWRRIIDINLWGVIYGIDAALPIMRRQGGGHIVNIASVSGLMPIPYNAVYCATKYAVAGLSESLRFELADTGIHVSVVCPGHVATRIFSNEQGETFAPPADAVPAADAARAILSGVANLEGMIVLPEATQAFWRRYWRDPESFESILLDMARSRGEKLRATGMFY